MTSESPRTGPIDPVTFEVIWHRILDITEEMGIKYMRNSGSPVLVGAYDAATGIHLADGQLVAMGPYITTQGHVLRLIIESVMQRRGADIGINSGDMFICNDPYLGATHQPDVATVAPVHDDDRLVAWVGSSGHWLDIGGSEPGGFNMNAVSVYDEGLRLPAIRLVEGGRTREDLVDMIMSNVREPLAELDLRGQVVSNRTGVERLQELFDAYGTDTVVAVMEEAISHTERRFRERLRKLPDGVFREVQWLDHDGHGPNLRQIVCTMTKRGDKLTVDFTGSAPEVAGFANCAFGGLRAATLSGLCTTLCWDIPWNDGVARCIDIVVPKRTIVSAEEPTPVSMSTISAIIVTLNLVMATAGKILATSPTFHEEAMAGWCGTSLGVSILGENDRGEMTVCAEASHFAAGCGARTYADGVDTGGIIINTTANIPSIEQTEAAYPVLYLYRRQLADSGGPGRFRGGLSGTVAIAPYDAGGPLESSFSGVGAEMPNGFGLAGGLPGAAARFVRYEGAGTVDALSLGDFPTDEAAIPGSRTVMPINSSHDPFPADAVEMHNWQGGGGFGDPLDREVDFVLADITAGGVSAAMAEEVYGVVAVDGNADLDATKTRRDSMRANRLERARPAAEVIDDDDAWVEAVKGLTAAGSGVAPYGDAIEFDFDAGEIRCDGVRLCGLDEDFRRALLVEQSSLKAAGPARGEDYDRGQVVLRRFYSPFTGRQVDAEVSVVGAPRAAFRVVSPTGER